MWYIVLKESYNLWYKIAADRATFDKLIQQPIPEEFGLTMTRAKKEQEAKAQEGNAWPQGYQINNH